MPARRHHPRQAQCQRRCGVHGGWNVPGRLPLRKLRGLPRKPRAGHSVVREGVEVQVRDHRLRRPELMVLPGTGHAHRSPPCSSVLRSPPQSAWTELWVLVEHRPRDALERPYTAGGGGLPPPPPLDPSSPSNV